MIPTRPQCSQSELRKHLEQDVSALPPYDTYLPPAPPCQITLDTDLGASALILSMGFEVAEVVLLMQWQARCSVTTRSSFGKRPYTYPCESLPDCKAGVADAVIVAQRVVETLRVEDFPGCTAARSGQQMGLTNACRHLVRSRTPAGRKLCAFDLV